MGTFCFTSLAVKAPPPAACRAIEARPTAKIYPSPNPIRYSEGVRTPPPAAAPRCPISASKPSSSSGPASPRKSASTPSNPSPPERSEEFFLELNSRQQSDLLQDLPDGINRLWIRQLAPDDAADLIQFAPKERWPHLLGLLDETSRREVTALLAYQEDAAGGLMSPRFARLRPEMTADEAISYLRRQTTHLETIYYGYVLDENQRLRDVRPHARRSRGCARDKHSARGSRFESPESILCSR